MNYADLKAHELRELCEARGIKPSRAKADMIADLEARDAADELTRLSQELGLPDEPLTASEDGTAPEAQDEAEKPAERPVVALEVADWVEDHVFLKRFPRNPNLDSWEHQANLRDVAEYARASGFETFGPAFRVAHRTTPTDWVYGINVRWRK